MINLHHKLVQLSKALREATDQDEIDRLESEIYELEEEIEESSMPYKRNQDR